jgi:hypothetical protein
MIKSTKITAAPKVSQGGFSSDGTYEVLEVDLNSEKMLLANPATGEFIVLKIGAAKCKGIASSIKR